MNKIKCLLVDDEPPAIALLQNYIEMIDQLEVVSTSHSAIKAFDQLNNKEIDLIFLDIQMPVLNGIDFIKSLSNPPAIILTTAHRDFALEGFELDIVDYLLKPITFDRFLKSVDRYRRRFESPVKVQVEETQDPAHLFFNVNRTHHKVVLDDILYVESLKDYVRIFMIDGSNLIVKGNIGSLMKQLPERSFTRIHRSYAIAMKYIKSYNQSEVEVGNKSLPIGISYRNTIANKLK